MKFLLEVKIPTEVANKKLKDGSLIKEMHAYLGEIKPEAIYFGIRYGARTLFMVVNAPAPEKLPEICEPLWLDWSAHVEVLPVMDSHKFEKAGPGIQKVLKSR